MRIQRFFCVSVLLFCSPITFAAKGTFSTLAYNVAGLPEIASSAESHRQEATEQISCYINQFDIVNVQEDFNYHAALYDTCNNHQYRSPTSGGAGIGSGLNTLSHFPYEDWNQIRWKQCNGVDCLTPKGFTLARVRLSDGIYLDVYNLHTQAQIETDDLKARRANLLQLAEYIEQHSVGNAVIITGDTNTRYTRSGDNIREFLNRGFTDAWLSLIRKNNIPVSGADALVCHPPLTSEACEIVDKVLFRDNGYLNLAVKLYAIREDAKNTQGQELSDHPPVEARWSYQTNPDWKFSNSFGGPHGTEFNDFALLPESPVVKQISIRTGKRLDQLKITLTNGDTFLHGGQGGDISSLTLAKNEFLKSATFCSAMHKNHTRIFYARLNTNQSQTISGGTQTENCTTFTAPEGWAIVGFYGRSGDEIDKTGAIYSPIRESENKPEQAQALTHNASGLCLDLKDQVIKNENQVVLWPCTDEKRQFWRYDNRTGLIRNSQNPSYCLDSSGIIQAGAKLSVSACTGRSSQRFIRQNDRTMTMKTMPALKLSSQGMTAGTPVTLSQTATASQQIHQ